jgi:hypothetical protein
VHTAHGKYPRFSVLHLIQTMLSRFRCTSGLGGGEETLKLIWLLYGLPGGCGLSRHRGNCCPIDREEHIEENSSG